MSLPSICSTRDPKLVRPRARLLLKKDSTNTPCFVPRFFTWFHGHWIKKFEHFYFLCSWPVAWKFDHQTQSVVYHRYLKTWFFSHAARAFKIRQRSVPAWLGYLLIISYWIIPLSPPRYHKEKKTLMRRMAAHEAIPAFRARQEMVEHAKLNSCTRILQGDALSKFGQKLVDGPHPKPKEGT